MNAVTFFKSMGLKAVKQYLENNNIRTKEMHDELKQIVEAFELVDQWGGLENAKLYDLSHCKSKPESMGYKLMQAINLVEQCQK